jgi:glycosyltransferase involved in cell wall biosynthesis
LKILVNAIPLTCLLTGISRYVRQLYTELDQFPDVEITYFDGNRILKNMPSQAGPGKWSRAISAIWKLPDPVVFAVRTLHWWKFEMLLRRACRKGCYDIYHETGFVPAAMSAVPTVYSIYDLSLIKFRHAHPKERVWFYDFMGRRRLHFARHILTISEFIRQEICETLALSPSKVSAVPLAPARHFYPRSAEKIDLVRRRYRLAGRYLLFVGSLEPRKNLPLLIQAMKRSETNISLLLVGWEGWGDKSWMQTIRESELAQRIVLTGYVDDETLACLYSGAMAFVYPSLYEGFGLPILEAMACGCPVICSDVASMPEVAGDAAIRFDPASIRDLTAAIDFLAGDQNARQRLIACGFDRAADFTWKQTAEKTRDVFQKMVSGDLLR